ncbi:hypothetical protein EDD18DRAFT_1063485, partial [Armillaria luteobubalina]
GYIYTFGIGELDDSRTLQLKVGCVVNVVRQLNEWGGLCGSEERVLRDFGRGSVGDGKDGTSLMNGRLILPEGGNEDMLMACLERLIRLGLPDLVMNAGYLQPG